MVGEVNETRLINSKVAKDEWPMTSLRLYEMMTYALGNMAGLDAKSSSRAEMRSESICEIKFVIHCSGMESCHICRLGLWLSG
jgi:hypothetical protein